MVKCGLLIFTDEILELLLYYKWDLFSFNILSNCSFEI